MKDALDDVKDEIAPKGGKLDKLWDEIKEGEEKAISKTA